MQDTLKILESVNQFYSSSFSQLVVITIALLSFTGVVLPIIFTLYQKRLFKLEHDEIIASLSQELDLKFKASQDIVNENLKIKEAEHKLKIAELEVKFERELMRAHGISLQTQGKLNIQQCLYRDAFTHLVQAAINFISSKSEDNLAKTLHLIGLECLYHLYPRELESNDEFDATYKLLLDNLNPFNDNGRYDLTITHLNFYYNQSKKEDHRRRKAG